MLSKEAKQVFNAYSRLFRFMNEEHDLILTCSQIDDLVKAVEVFQKETAYQPNTKFLVTTTSTFRIVQTKHKYVVENKTQHGIWKPYFSFWPKQSDVYFDTFEQAEETLIGYIRNQCLSNFEPTTARPAE